MLTTHHLSELHFNAPRRARRRLLELTREKVIQRFQPHRQTGSNPQHYVLGPIGVEILAAERGLEPRELGVRPSRLRQLEHSQRLRHLMEINSFFCRLAYLCRRLADAALETWWGEARCAATWSPIVRPDGFGVVRIGGLKLRFFLEIDRGTEEHERIATKCAEYARAARLSNAPDVLLFILPTGRREIEVRRVLGGCGLPTYTTTRDRIEDDPFARAWLGTDSDHRQTLDEIMAEVNGEY